MNKVMTELIKPSDMKNFPVISKEDSRKQFDYWTEKLSLKHTFSFDEAYDYLMERRINKEKQNKFRKTITEFEDKLKLVPGVLGADPYPLEHSFADGLYIRKLTVPANTLTVTKIHAVNHAFFLQKGTISVLTEEGVKKFTAPYQGITKAGTKRIIYHHDEVIFTTVHSTKENDINKIEVEVIAEDFEDLNNRVEAERLINFLEIISESEE